MRWRGGEVFGSFPAKYRSSQRLPSLSAGVSFVCTSAGRVAAKYFCPSNQRPVSPTSSAARRMSPSGESKCCMNVIIYLIYLEMQGNLTGCIASSLYRKREEDAICGIPSSRRACPFHELKNFLFTNINAACILVTSLILNKDKERKRVNRFSGRELPYGERQQRVLTKSSASPVSE